MWFPLLARKSGSVIVTTTRVVTIPNTSAPGPLVNGDRPPWKGTALGYSTGVITRRGNVAACATIDNQNARNEATTEMRPR